MHFITDMLGFLIQWLFPAFAYIKSGYDYTYKKEIKFRLFMNSFFSFKREVHFKLSLSFERKEKVFNEFEKVLKNKKIDYRIQMRMDNHKIYNIDGFLIDILLNDNTDFDDGSTFISVIDQRVSLRTGNRTIELFGMLMTILAKNLNVETENYNFQIIYDKKNPFISMNLSSMGSDNLKEFHCKINSDKLLSNNTTKNNDYIDINKRCASFNNSDYIVLENVAKKLLLVRG